MPEQEDMYEKPIPFGVLAGTGCPLAEIDDATLEFFADQPSGESPEDDSLKAKAEAATALGRAVAHYGITADADPNLLSESGWAVMFSASVDQRIKDALQPLLDHRKAQISDERLFKIFEGNTGYQPGQTATTWLSRLGVGMDVVNPLQGVPFYLLLVGPPDEVPFEFQYGLDIYWAVGRLWFPTADEFRQYALSVIQYENPNYQVATSRQTAIFSPRHDFDQATQLFCKQVAAPLVEGTSIAGPIGAKQKFSTQSFIGETAKKQALEDIFCGRIHHGTPSLLLSGSHGMAFQPDDPLQTEKQGALVCQDWGGYGSITPDDWFAASDLPANARLRGMIHILFACYGGGCPKFDNFHRAEKSPKQIAAEALIGRLPQAMLAHPEGGALAIVAHVERAWAYSFQTERRSPQIEGFRNVSSRILRGERLGQAMDQFNGHWAALSTELSEVLNQISNGMAVPPQKLANMWVARDDARNYIILGDPAVCLRVNDMPVLPAEVPDHSS